MKSISNKLVTIAVFFASFFILIGTIYSLYIDMNYFLSKKEAIVTISDSIKSDNSILIRVNYKNDYVDSIVKSSITLDKRKGDIVLNEYKNKGHIVAYYAKNYPNEIYMENINAPRTGIILFYLLIIAAMLLSMYFSVVKLKRKGTG